MNQRIDHTRPSVGHHEAVGHHGTVGGQRGTAGASPRFNAAAAFRALLGMVRSQQGTSTDKKARRSSTAGGAHGRGGSHSGVETNEAVEAASSNQGGGGKNGQRPGALTDKERSTWIFLGGWCARSRRISLRCSDRRGGGSLLVEPGRRGQQRAAPGPTRRRRDERRRCPEIFVIFRGDVGTGRRPSKRGFRTELDFVAASCLACGKAAGRVATPGFCHLRALIGLGGQNLDTGALAAVLYAVESVAEWRSGLARGSALGPCRVRSALRFASSFLAPGVRRAPGREKALPSLHAVARPGCRGGVDRAAADSIWPLVPRCHYSAFRGAGDRRQATDPAGEISEI